MLATFLFELTGKTFVFANLLIILASSLVVIAFFRRLKLPPVLGYLCVGLFVGPTALDWINDSPNLPDLAELGVVFLLVYGALRFRAALRGGEALQPSEVGSAPLGKVLLTCLLLTWANPHVYLDTVVLLGSISAQYPGHRLAFGGAAVVGSFSFFTALGYGARLLAPVFANPRAWVVLELLVGATMWAIAAALAFGG